MSGGLQGGRRRAGDKQQRIRPATAGQPGREHETKIKKLSLRKKTFSAIRSVWLEFLLRQKTNYPPFRFISLILSACTKIR
jgi:hypothetical protein